MTSGAFSFNVTTDITCLEGKQTSKVYVVVFDIHLLPNAETLDGRNCLYQQENALIHISKLTEKRFVDNSAHVMVWPACCLDLNPVEIIWDFLAHSTYASLRQLVRELKKK